MRQSARGLRLNSKLTLAYSLLILVVAGVLTSSLYVQLRNTQRQAFRDRLQDILGFAAPLIDGDYHSLILTPQDEQTSYYAIISARLESIARTSPVISRISTVRRQPDQGAIYIADYQANRPARAHVGDAYPAALAAGDLTAPLVSPDLIVEQDGRVLLRGFAPIFDQSQRVDGLLSIDVDAAPILASELRIQILALLVFLGTVPLALLFGWLLTRRLTAPVADLVSAATLVAQGDLQQQVLVRSSDELGDLAAAFNTMAGALQERIATQQATQDELQASNVQMQSLLDLVRDLETPVIPLLRGVLAVPIVGQLDSRRAAHLTQVVLEMVHQQRARMILIDITGIVAFDAEAARSIEQLAQSIQLLGARTMLTGIKAQVAQTMVEIGIDFSAIETAGSLEDGMALVLQALPAAAGPLRPARPALTSA